MQIRAAFKLALIAFVCIELMPHSAHAILDYKDEFACSHLVDFALLGGIRPTGPEAFVVPDVFRGKGGFHVVTTKGERYYSIPAGQINGTGRYEYRIGPSEMYEIDGQGHRSVKKMERRIAFNHGMPYIKLVDATEENKNQPNVLDLTYEGGRLDDKMREKFRRQLSSAIGAMGYSNFSSDARKSADAFYSKDKIEEKLQACDRILGGKVGPKASSPDSVVNKKAGKVD